MFNQIAGTFTGNWLKDFTLEKLRICNISAQANQPILTVKKTLLLHLSNSSCQSGE